MPFPPCPLCKIWTRTRNMWRLRNVDVGDEHLSKKLTSRHTLFTKCRQKVYVCPHRCVFRDLWSSEMWDWFQLSWHTWPNKNSRSQELHDAQTIDFSSLLPPTEANMLVSPLPTSLLTVMCSWCIKPFFTVSLFIPSFPLRQTHYSPPTQHS